MTDAALQKKLNQLAKLANELDDEAKARYGPEAMLFFEADGAFHIMDGDSNDGVADRQEHIQFSSRHCRMGAGAW